jgi:cell division protease FtsH
LIWLVLLVTVVALTLALDAGDTPQQVRSFEQYAEDLARGEIAGLHFEGEALVASRVDGSSYVVAGSAEIAQGLAYESGLPIRYEEDGPSSLITLGIPITLAVVFAVVFFRRLRNQQQGGAGGNIFAMRQTTARVLKAGTEKLRFSDVGGAEEAKERLRDVVDFLKNPKKWQDAGVRIPKGVLLEGPPGCGKTLLARAVAGEAGVQVFVVAASEFVEMFVGVGAARIRSTFEAATKAAPAVLFIDELDAVGRKRGSGVGASHDEREQTLNQLLVCLDGFEGLARVVVIAATNRSDVLDRALLRPGRFDVRVVIPAPDVAARKEILAVHTRGKRLATDVSLDALAARTEGLSGAELEHLCNEAAMSAVRRVDTSPVFVAAADFQRALDARTRAEVSFDRLDQLLLESASQLARPSGPVFVALTTSDGTTLEGELKWADATFLKLVPRDGPPRVIAKGQVSALRALEGTGAVRADEAVGDPWAGRRAELA